ncbi:MAG: prepilin-type N-terminal cleavage/methylation domain-containing protein [Bacilli bacterium]|nr:prepilin-type N-terminal cleavage/methylation domain-containing protein [Bacilli bacterium]
MRNNSRKHEGFTLLEVIISMALIAIISVGVYNGYLLLIKQTKAGQVKQMAALSGKKTIEEIKASKVFNGTLNIDDQTIVLKKFSDTYTTKTSIDVDYKLNKDDYIHLDKDFKLCKDQNSNNYVYLEEVTLIKNSLSPSNNGKSGSLYDVTVAIKDEKDNLLFNGKCNETINIGGD